MKQVSLLLLLLSQLSFGQTWPEEGVEEYCSKIDDLRSEEKLLKVDYPDMSSCGGALDGYYRDGELLFIDSRYGAELGFSSKKIYFENDSIIRIIYREYFAEWEKYAQQYPAEEFEWDPSKMTFSDTLYTITFSTPIHFTKSSKEKIIDQAIDYELIKRLKSCVNMMRNELDEY